MNTYDYVVVGAGSAGCVLAARLSEDPGTRVALIEAGGPDTAQDIHVPAAFSRLFKSDLDWDLDSEPEPGIGGRRAYLPRGKVLGGCSSINAMIYIRGNRADYDGWAAAGAEGWSYDDVLPYFRRPEDNTRGADAFHGTGGPLTVSDSRSNHPWSPRSSRRPSRRDTPATTTSTAAASSASAPISSPSATDCGAAPPSPSSTRPWNGRTSRW